MSKSHKLFDFDATVIADSLNPANVRLTSIMITFPRFILAEMNTHRAFSRNSASSRAIPFETMLKRVSQTPFIPLRFQKDHSGMQGTEYFEGSEEEIIRHEWVNTAYLAAEEASNLNSKGVTKQLCNRLLEPFLWHTVIITSTEWQNFFSLRVDPAAEIHMQKIAELMLEAMNGSTPKELNDGEWHIPFGDEIDDKRLFAMSHDGVGCTEEDLQFAKVKIACARCARLSYLNYEGKDDYQADIKLYDRLSKMGHMSPFEHVARASEGGMRLGNFRGFVQHRKDFPNENRSDSRLVEKLRSDLI